MTATMIMQDVQKAVYAYLAANAPFMAACGNRFFDAVPQGTVYPLVALRVSSKEDGDKTQPGERVEIEVHVWSQYEGSKECQDIVKLAYALLHSNPVAARSATVQTSLLVYDDAGIFIEPDGVTRHALARFHTRSQSPTQA